MNYKELFSKTPPTKLFFTAAIPGSIGMLASALYQTIDGMLVGRILSGNAFAALNLAIFLSAPALIGLMGAEGELAELAVQYLRVYCLCSPFTTIVFAMDNYLKICGRVRSSMALNIVMSVLSAALEFLFLFVFRWGIWAAALGTCTSMFMCALAALYPFFRKKMQLRFVRPKFDRTMMKTIVTCGSPNFLNNVAGRITSIIMNVILLQVGGATAVSVYGILMFADGFVQPLLYGMCDSLQPAVGYNWGAGALKRVSSAYLVRWFSFAAQSYMSAVEKPVPAMVISVCSAVAFPLVMIVLLWPMGLKGLWLNVPGTSLLAAVLAFFILNRFEKKEMNTQG